MAFANGIMYLLEEGDFAVVDIPTSIASAQEGILNTAFLQSTHPRQVPYPSLEPTSATKRLMLQPRSRRIVDLYKHYQEAISFALQAVESQGFTGPWHATRHNVLSLEIPPEAGQGRPSETQSRSNRKRKRNEEEDNYARVLRTMSEPASPRNAHTEQAKAIFNLMNGVIDVPRFEFTLSIVQLGPRSPAEPAADKSSWEPFLHNDCDFTTELIVLNNDMKTKAAPPHYADDRPSAPQILQFLLPPGCSLFLGKSWDFRNFKAALKESQLTGDSNTVELFDLILIDPPWQNLSAKRSGVYKVVKDEGGFDNLHVENLRQFMKVYGHVGVWITNSQFARERVLGRGGLFDHWNVQLLEEWIYVKVTSTGELLQPLDGVWRKPYEILLIGKAYPVGSKISPIPNGKEWDEVMDDLHVRTRVIFACPDLHSRKPCLKELFHLWLNLPKEKSKILEVFARYCVANWWSWGDECIKFNAKNCWKLSEDQPEAS